MAVLLESLRSRLPIHESHEGNRRFAQALLNESEAKGGLAEYFSDTRDIDALLRVPGTTLRKDSLIESTALMMDNLRCRLGAMDETTRSLNVGGFQDFLFPMIRTFFPQNPILDLVSIQPQSRRIGQVMYLNFKYGKTKGRYQAGTRIFDAFTGFAGGSNYSDEFVDGESLGTGNSSTTTFTRTLSYVGSEGGVRPGTVVVNYIASDNVTAAQLRDNGNGGFVQEFGGTDLGSGAATINYGTGAVSIVFGTAPGNGAITISYEYDSEGSSTAPQIEFDIASSPIVANRRMLTGVWTMDAEQDAANELGQSVSQLTAEGIGATIVAEQTREVIRDLWNLAGAPFATFSLNYVTSTFQISRREYLADLMARLPAAFNQILLETQRYNPNWMIVDVGFKTVLDAIGAPHYAQWSQAPVQNNLGVQFIGTLNGNIRVYCDPLLNTLPGTYPDGNALIGYKGSDFQEAGYIWAPYIPFFSTPQVTLSDMKTQQGWASRVGKKAINPRIYKRFALTMD